MLKSCIAGDSCHLNVFMLQVALCTEASDVLLTDGNNQSVESKTWSS